MKTPYRCFVLAVSFLLGCGLAGLLFPAAASADEAGWIRTAHLSPDTPRVDVYVTSFARPNSPTVLKGVGYGTVSDYQRIAPGTYTVAMRSQGAPASAAPVLSTTLQVKPGKAYTVAGVGRNADLVLSVIDDQRVSPPPGQGRVRVIQASSDAPSVDITTSAGMTVVDDAQFPATTAYSAVPAGKWTLRVTPVDGPAAPVILPINVAAGGVYSLLVLDKQNADGIEVAVRQDSAGAALMPRGGIRTGLGGGRRPAGKPDHTGPVLAVGALLAAAGFARLTADAARLARSR